jgi:hypothetical protein
VRKRKEEMCEVGCWVDGEGVAVGYPVLAFNSTTSVVVRWHGEGRGGAWGVLVSQVIVASVILQMFM